MESEPFRRYARLELVSLTHRTKSTLLAISIPHFRPPLSNDHSSYPDTLRHRCPSRKSIITRALENTHLHVAVVVLDVFAIEPFFNLSAASASFPSLLEGIRVIRGEGRGDVPTLRKL